MVKSFILAFNDEQITRPDLTNLIDSMEEIVNWSAFFPGAIVVVSELGVKEICDAINQKREKKFQYLLIEPKGKNGWLPKDVWTFINIPRPV